MAVLSKEKACELIDIVSCSNYMLAKPTDSVFDNLKDMFQYLYSDQFTELELVVPYQHGIDVDSFTVAFDNDQWVATGESSKCTGKTLGELMESIYQSGLKEAETSEDAYVKFVPKDKKVEKFTELISIVTYGCNNKLIEVVIDAKEHLLDDNEYAVAYDFIKEIALSLHNIKLSDKAKAAIDKSVIALLYPKSEFTFGCEYTFSQTMCEKGGKISVLFNNALIGSTFKTTPEYQGWIVAKTIAQSHFESGALQK